MWSLGGIAFVAQKWWNFVRESHDCKGRVQAGAMKRRTFLVATAGLVGELASRLTFAQGNVPGSRAAVVISVD